MIEGESFAQLENIQSQESFSGHSQENISGVQGENFEGKLNIPSFENTDVSDKNFYHDKSTINDYENFSPLSKELPSFDNIDIGDVNIRDEELLDVKNGEDDTETSSTEITNVENTETQNKEQHSTEITDNVEEKNDVSNYHSSYDERLENTPKDGERGCWNGERGESKYIPSDPDIQDALDKYEMNGVEYKDGIPDFSDCSKATVEIDNMTANRDKGPDCNFAQADQKCSEQWNQETRDGRDDWTARDVANWRKENHYTWHECNDLKTCQLLPRNIHSNFQHFGGVGEYNRAGHVSETNKQQKVLFDE